MKRVLVQSLKNRYVILIATVAVIITINQSIVQYSINLQYSNTQTINMSGKQRLLSQQIIRFAESTVNSNERILVQTDFQINILKQLLAEFETSHLQLTSGNNEIDDPILDSLFTQINPYYEAILSKGKTIALSKALDSPQTFISSMNQESEAFLITMEAVVGEYERIAEDGIDNLKKIELILSAIALITLLVEFLFVVSPVFKENRNLIALNVELETTKKKILLKDKEKQRVEEILDKANEVARIGTWEVDLVKGTVIWSRITREIHEVPNDFIPDLSKGIEFYREGASRNNIQKAINEAIESNVPFDLELELVTAKGNFVWTRAIGQAETADGKCIRLYGVFQDINAIKKSQIALKSVNEELSIILNAGPVSIITTDTNGIITHFNRGAEALLQYSSFEMVGKNSPAILHLEEEVIERGEELSKEYGREISGFDVFTEYAIQGKFESKKWTYVRKDGSTLPVQLMVTALKNNEDEITGFIGVGTDITEIVENEQKLQESKNNLEDLSERLTVQNHQLANFAHIASHNIRSPISNLNSLLHLHKLSGDSSEKIALFEKFETVVEHLSETLNTLVESIKIREDYNMETDHLTFEKIYEKTYELISAQILEAGAKINMDFSKAPSLVYNRLYMESIMLNLLTNTLKYRSPERTLEVSIKTENNNGKIKLVVSDNGLGIDLEKHGHKLFGLNKTFHRHPEAKGVGLYITKTQVESMGGTISAISNVNEGSIFTINF